MPSEERFERQVVNFAKGGFFTPSYATGVDLKLRKLQTTIYVFCDELNLL